ncbi:class I SAM-dependent methyltransferase [Sphingomonas sp. dw_22]|uniref:class I SAM-dependent methyltransferase n=1 Tax=Sphingomonas sp. dw_22 TaxID=2721175 RepID=UPI001BD64583|nr:class I SAM-dependent methyltransferase [Sphingomonas sp. dw_22]
MSAGEAERLIGAAAQLAQGGDAGRALQALSRALDLAPEIAAAPYAALVSQITPRGYFAKLDHDLRVCLAAESVDPQTLARVTARLLLLKPDAGDGEADPLWVAFLTRCINVDAGMEARLVAMAEAPGGLREALAAQAFAGEYVWGGEALGVPAGAVAELAEEQALAGALPSLGELGDRVSAAVRAQYEANPYPRWRAPPAPRRVLVRELLRSMGGMPGESVAVLIAGCGTGYEPIDLARTDPSLSITALDLSRASLAYGQRMAAALGVGNVWFVAGDLLEAARLGQRFDLVSSTGVLHHMARPEEGLAALVGVLRPGGLLRIALYSERARGWVRAAHRVIAERGWEATAEGIRAFRAHVLALPEGAELARLRESDDFYTLSGCRDLCFHAQEHWYRLPQVAAMLRSVGLELVRFDAPPEAMALFRGDPLDLAAWDALEERHPLLFAGMYHFWCRRVDR